MAVTVTGLAATGALLGSDATLTTQMVDYHYLLGAALVPFLGIRLYLLFFGSGTDHISDCETDSHRLSQAWKIIKYYLTLGRAPLPKWYGHNPLWGPIYLLLFLFLAISAVTGILLIEKIHHLGQLSLFDIHIVISVVINAFILLHIPAVFFHDLSSQCSDISGMVSGYKTFQVGENKPLDMGLQSVPVRDLLKSRTHKK
jgi:Ni/Fe-hydrogenase 1 B-type cytochrome subunit